MMLISQAASQNRLSLSESHANQQTISLLAQHEPQRHNSIRVAQNLRGRDLSVQINLVRLTYGHHNLLISLNCAETELSNPLNQLDYNDSLELIKSLFMLNSRDTRDLDNSLIKVNSGEIADSANSLIKFNSGEMTDSGKLSDSPSLGNGGAKRSFIGNQSAKFLANEKGSISNSILWDVADLQHKKNQSVNTITQCNPVNRLSLRGLVRHLCGTERLVQNYPENIGSVYSLGFFRCRRFISPLAAVTRNPAVLSPSSFKFSISSITSWGILTVVICDFAFFTPVAITEIP